MKETLWSKNFTLIMLGTVISAIGGVGLSLALSVTVYDNTQSTWLTGLYSALTIIPSILLPVLISPIVDKYSRKSIIVTLDLILGIVFLIFAWLTKTGYFNFYFYVLMGLIMNVNGVIYSLAYDSLFPNLIPKGMFQKGYAIGNLIYPLTNVVVLPLATVIFHYFGVAFMFMLEGVLLIIASTFERRIDIVETTKEKIVFNVKSHFKDIREGFRYLKQEKAIWNVYLFFVIIMFADGINILIYPFFENSATLSVVDYSLLLVAPVRRLHVRWRPPLLRQDPDAFAFRYLSLRLFCLRISRCFIFLYAICHHVDHQICPRLYRYELGEYPRHIHQQQNRRQHAWPTECRLSNHGQLLDLAWQAYRRLAGRTISVYLCGHRVWTDHRSGHLPLYFEQQACDQAAL